MMMMMLILLITIIVPLMIIMMVRYFAHIKTYKKRSGGTFYRSFVAWNELLTLWCSQRRVFFRCFLGRIFSVLWCFEWDAILCYVKHLTNSIGWVKWVFISTQLDQWSFSSQWWWVSSHDGWLSEYSWENIVTIPPPWIAWLKVLTPA